MRTIDDCRAPAFDDGAQILERLRERLHALFLQLLADLDQVDPGRREPLDDIARLGDVLRERRPRLAMVAKRIHRRGRHRVDGVGVDEFLDVLDVAVRVILGAGGRPQWPLRTPALREHVLESSAGENFLVTLVDEPRVGDRRLAHQRGDRLVRRALQFIFELAIDESLDAADEHARHRPDLVDGFTRPEPAFEAADKRLGDVVVVLN